MTPETPPTDRPLMAGDVRYVDGHLDMTHAPSLGAFIGKSLASHVSGNRMPAMSGDNRERIPAHIRERFDRDCESTAQYILDHLSRPATSAASEGEGVERTIDGETVLGFKVAAWRYLGPKDDARFGYRLCEHWSTPGNHPQKVERLFTETQLRAALASPPVSERERELEGALGLIADGWDVIESSGSMGEMTLQAPDDWEGDQTEIVVKFHGLTAQPQEPV